MNKFFKDTSSLRVRDGRPGYAQDHNNILSQTTRADYYVGEYVKTLWYRQGVANLWVNSSRGSLVQDKGFSIAAHLDYVYDLATIGPDVVQLDGTEKKEPTVKTYGACFDGLVHNLEPPSYTGVGNETVRGAEAIIDQAFSRWSTARWWKEETFSLYKEVKNYADGLESLKVVCENNVKPDKWLYAERGGLFHNFDSVTGCDTDNGIRHGMGELVDFSIGYPVCNYGLQLGTIVGNEVAGKLMINHTIISGILDLNGDTRPYYADPKERLVSSGGARPKLQVATGNSNFLTFWVKGETEVEVNGAIKTFGGGYDHWDFCKTVVSPNTNIFFSAESVLQVYGFTGKVTYMPRTVVMEHGGPTKADIATSLPPVEDNGFTFTFELEDLERKDQYSVLYLYDSDIDESLTCYWDSDLKRLYWEFRTGADPFPITSQRYTKDLEYSGDGKIHLALSISENLDVEFFSRGRGQLLDKFNLGFRFSGFSPDKIRVGGYVQCILSQVKVYQKAYKGVALESL